MPKNLHDEGTQTIAPDRNRVQVNDGSREIERIDNAKHYDSEGFISTPHVSPEITTYKGLQHEILGEFESSLNEERKKIGALKALNDAEARTQVSQNISRLDRHMTEFQQQYLAEHPDGKGLRKAVAQELYNGITIHASNGDWKDSASNIIMAGFSAISPDVQREAVGYTSKVVQSHLSNALVTEYTTGRQYRFKSALNEFKALKFGMQSAVSVADYAKFENQFQCIAKSIETDFSKMEGDKVVLSKEGEQFLQEYKNDFQMAFVKTVVHRNPSQFLVDVKAGKYAGLMNSNIIDGGKALAGDLIAKQQLKEKKEADSILKSTITKNSMLARQQFERDLDRAPWMVLDRDILNSSTLMPKDRDAVLKYKAAKLNAYSVRDAYNNEAIRSNNLGLGIGHLPASIQEDVVINTLKDVRTDPQTGESVLSPSEIVETANSLGSTAEATAYANSLISDLMHSENTDIVFDIVKGYAKAQETHQPILGDLNKANNQYANEICLAARCSGVAFDEPTEKDKADVLRLRNHLFDNRKYHAEQYKGDNSDIKNILDKQNNFIDKIDFQPRYDEMLQEFKEEYLTEDAFPFGRLSVLQMFKREKQFINKRAQEEMLRAFDNDIKKDVATFYSHGWGVDNAFKMAKQKFYDRYQPTCIYGDNEEMMLNPPEQYIPGSAQEGSNAQTALRLRMATIATHIQDLSKDKNFYIPNNTTLIYNNPPKVRNGSAIQIIEDEMIGTETKNSNGLTKKAYNVFLPQIEKYEAPTFTMIDGTSGEKTTAYLTLEKTETRDASYAAVLLTENNETIPLRRADGHLFTIDFNDPDLVMATEEKYYSTKAPVKYYTGKKKVAEEEVNGK